MLKRLPDRDIDPALRAILEEARSATEALEIPFFVGGAMARDITLTHVFGQEVKRATRDVDLGLYLDNWDRFQHLKNALVDTCLFHAVDGKPHRLHYGSPKGIPLDLIPFGRIEHPAGEIAWPPGNDVVLNVAGFEDAFRSALVVDLGAGLVIKTCALPSLAVLKLIAWHDRRKYSNKDATDLLFIAQNYAAADNMDRLYERESKLMEAADYNPELAGAYLLGKDAALQSGNDTAAIAKAILENKVLQQELIDQIVRAKAVSHSREDEQRYTQYLKGFSTSFLKQLGELGQ
ncbi:nucleotidyl transferase AbiEii/AbiGii toxin family protein [Acidovorax sp. JG5]|uniref:nucleotidyl transferase AbiEii/AbiGii toxin family protein n=1 Tax=Acidovorax sp. JG5 TaxID=2822718 RepID=UPI001B33C983|nr:nucleotidyl transferase AbiEii/AbiGii toxin family protein [Acidovorax sp. JG5]MBP3979362.1 nucleotidyl transferase AbiEii/AbiGii toxin family protein [Acidovorax sp. JG5]